MKLVAWGNQPLRLLRIPRTHERIMRKKNPRNVQITKSAGGLRKDHLSASCTSGWDGGRVGRSTHAYFAQLIQSPFLGNTKIVFSESLPDISIQYISRSEGRLINTF